MNLREHSIWRLSKRRLSRSLERNMKHGYSKRRINQPMKIQIITFERCNMISIDQKFQISFFYRKDETHSNIEIVLYSKEEWNYKKNILCEDVLRSPIQDSRSSPHTRPPHHTTPDPLSPDLSLLTGADSPIQIYLYISTFKKRAWQAEAVAFIIQMLEVRSDKSTFEIRGRVSENMIDEAWGPIQ